MNPIIPKTNSLPGTGAPASLLLGEIASNRTDGKLYLGTDAGIDCIGERVVSISRGGTASTTAASALTALGAAPLVSPEFTGIPTVPTASAGTDTTQAASTAFVQANRGDKYLTTSTTTWTIANTTQTFTVDAGLSYTPTQDVTVVYDSANHAHGQVVSYSGTSLTINFSNHTGNGTHSQWTINVGGLTVQDGALLQANNLSDVASPSAALANIGGFPLTGEVLGIAQGGTASTTQQAALNSIVGAVTAGQFLAGDGTNLGLRSILAADVSGFNAAASSAAPVQSVAGRTGIVTLTTADIASFSSAASAAAPVQSVAGRTGPITLTTADIGGLSSSYVQNGGGFATIRVLTQAQYNALTPDSNTVYIITA